LELLEISFSRGASGSCPVGGFPVSRMLSCPVWHLEVQSEMDPCCCPVRLDVVALVEHDSERMWSSLSFGCLLVRAVSFWELSGYSLGLGIDGSGASKRD